MWHLRLCCQQCERSWTRHEERAQHFRAERVSPSSEAPGAWLRLEPSEASEHAQPDREHLVVRFGANLVRGGDSAEALNEEAIGALTR